MCTRMNHQHIAAGRIVPARLRHSRPGRALLHLSAGARIGRGTRMYHSPSHLLSCYRTIYVPTLSGPAIGPLEVSHYQAASAGATPAQQRVKNEVIESIYEALGRHRDERPDIEVPQEWRQLFPAGRIVKVRIAHAFNGGGS